MEPATPDDDMVDDMDELLPDLTPAPPLEPDPQDPGPAFEPEPDPEPELPPAAEVPAQLPSGPVLVYAESEPYRLVHHGQQPPLVVSVGRGLSFVQREHLPILAQQERFRELVRPVAGLERPLADDWAELPRKQAQAMLERTPDVQVLEQLRELEGGLRRPRVEVLAAIGAAIDRVRSPAKGRGGRRAVLAHPRG